MFLTTLKQVGILVGYILIGYLLCRKKVVSRESSKTLSKLLIYIFAPAYTVPSLIRGLDAEYLLKYAAIFAAGVILTLSAILLSSLLSRFFADKGFERNVYRYMFAFSNNGYFGYPLVGAVFGDEVLANFMLFCLPVNIAINSYGYIILTENDGADMPEIKKSRGKDILKRLFSVPLLTYMIGIPLGLLPITMPQLFFDVLSPAAGCFSVSAMLLAGFSLSSYSPKQLFKGAKPYYSAAVRLLLIPLIMCGAVFALYKLMAFDRAILICTVAFAALPAGMNVVVFPEFAGKDGSIGAKPCFICYLMALATVPLWFYLLSVLI